MTEQSESDKYIKCSKCKCKYINDDEHIKSDFGYKRLGEVYKSCVKCRDKRNQPNIKEYDKQYYENNKEKICEYSRQYKEKQRNNQVVIECEYCGNKIKSVYMKIHQKTNECKQMTCWRHKVDTEDKNIGFCVFSDYSYYPYYKDLTLMLEIEGVEPPDLNILHFRST